MLKSFVPVAYEEVLSFYIGNKFTSDREVLLVTSSVLTMLIPTSDREVSLLTSSILIPTCTSDREVSLLMSSMFIPDWVCHPGNTPSSFRVKKIDRASSSKELSPYRTRPKFGSFRVKKIDRGSSSKELPSYRTRPKFGSSRMEKIDRESSSEELSSFQTSSDPSE